MCLSLSNFEKLHYTLIFVCGPHLSWRHWEISIDVKAFILSGYFRQISIIYQGWKMLSLPLKREMFERENNYCLRASFSTSYTTNMSSHAWISFRPLWLHLIHWSLHAITVKQHNPFDTFKLSLESESSATTITHFHNGVQ